MPDIYEQSAIFRAALLARDAAAVKALVAEHQAIYARLIRMLAALNNQIAERQRQGQEVSPAWLFRQERYQQLLRDLDREFQRYGAKSADIIEGRRLTEAARGARDAATLVETGIVENGVSASFNRLPSGAIESLVGNLRADTPLSKLFDSFGPDASNAARALIRDGVALGYNPNKVARQMKDALNVPLWRAQRIARTEALRAYRQSTQATYEENSDIVQMWEWVASSSRRTCAACLALDGKLFPLRKPLPGHPNCRCTSVPRFKEIPARPRQTGAEWFDAQTEAIQREIIGIRGAEMYRSGQIKLDDFIGTKQSKDWGEMRYQRSLKQILEDKGLKRAA